MNLKTTLRVILSLFDGGAAAAGAAAGAPGLAAALLAFWAGAAGAALRCVTLLDCWPNDFPPPMRRACASG